MTMLEVHPQFGPKVTKGTVRLYKGAIRLSRDLAIASRFTIQVNTKEKKMVLIPAPDREVRATEVWFSNKSAKSPMLSIASALELIGMSSTKAKGIYKAQIEAWAEGPVVLIDFSKVLK